MKRPELRSISINEFRALGYLQEVNRRFLHPLGLALSIEVDQDGDEKLSGIWDCREDEEGVFFGVDKLNKEEREDLKEKEVFITKELEKREAKRVELFGNMIEPI